MSKNLISILMFAGFAVSAPLFMLPMESDADSSITALWENSLTQVLKETGFEPVRVEMAHFEECENIDCVISRARSSGAQGLFRGRLKKSGDDSVSVRLHIDWLAGGTTPQTSVQGTAALSWDNAIKSGILHKLFSGITGNSVEMEPEEDKKTIIKVETNPDNAVIMLNGEAICYSPCDFSANEISSAQISAYWHSGENMWAAKRTVKLTGDTAKFFLELKRSFAETQIRTNPEKALVFPSNVLELNSKPLGKTPYVLRGLPGETQLRIFHKGYNDTLINVNIDAVEKQIQFVQLSPVTEPQKIAEQNLFAKSQTKRNIGLGLLGGSAGPLIVGIVLCKMAQNDYDHAKNLKKELELPSIGAGNFEAKVAENHKAVKDGDSKMVYGGGLIGLSLLLAGVGFAMSF